VLGAGQNSELVVDRLREAGATSTIVSSRRYERAVELAERFGGRPVRFEDIIDELARADIVIASTHAPHPMITAEHVRAVLGGEGSRAMFLIDLSIPRNVDPAVRDIENVHLYDLDSLQAFIDKTLAQRNSSVPRVKAIVEEEARDFIIWAKSRELVPLTLAILDAADALRQEELQEYLETARALSPKESKAVERLTRRIVHRLLREPLERLRELACTTEGARDLELAQYVFGIDGPLETEDEQPGG
jgi:glutamyl-tRNA reductase